MKKVGVITFSKSINPGAFLQAYALQQVLKKNKYDASLIDYQNSIDKKRYSVISTKTIKALFGSMFYLPLELSRKHNFSRAQKNLTYTTLEDNYDVAIAGSDQIWNPTLFDGQLDEKYFLDGIKATKKISYAASVANESIINRYENDFRKNLKKLNHISVREEAAKKKLEKLVNTPIQVTIDPVLLLNEDEWAASIKHKKIIEEPYVFTYFVGGISKKEIAPLSNVCEKLGMKCVSYSKRPLEKHIFAHAYNDGPFDFLAKLRDSQLVLTSSFHGVAFSIIFRKKFYYFLPRQGRRSRIDNILNLLGLTNRIIETENDISRINLEDIKYEKVQERLEKERNRSLKWLINAIED